MRYKSCVPLYNHSAFNQIIEDGRLVIATT